MENRINKFKHKGRVFIWKFSPDNKNYPGWNFTSDLEGCYSLIELLELMQASPFPSKKLIPTNPVTLSQVKAVTGSKSYKSARLLALDYRKGQPEFWQTDQDPEKLKISFGDRELEFLQTALQRIIKGEGDFAIGNSNDEYQVYFWWFMDK